MFKEIDLSDFPESRKNNLEKLYRYGYFDVLFYRSNLWNHSYRVLWLLEEIAPIAKKYLKIDMEKARALALVHDDAEIITGDIPSQEKETRSLEKEETSMKEELKAINELEKIYPKKINGYSYRQLLLHSAKKDCIEAQLVSYVDKIDAFCESLHEVYAGNIILMRSVVFYSRTIPFLPIKYPDLKPLLESKGSPLLDISGQISPDEIKAGKYKNLNKPHTKKSLQINTDFPFYKTWKQVLIKRGKTNWLIKQKEFLKD